MMKRKNGFSADFLQVSVKDPQSALLRGVTAQDDRDGNVTKAERDACYVDYRSPAYTTTIT